MTGTNVFLSLCMSVCMSLSLSINLSIYFFLSPSLYRSLFPSLSLSSLYHYKLIHEQNNRKKRSMQNFDHLSKRPYYSAFYFCSDKWTRTCGESSEPVGCRDGADGGVTQIWIQIRNNKMSIFVDICQLF